MTDYTDGFDGYQETTVDPGIWLLVATIVFCVVVMLVVMPLFVYRKMEQERQAKIMAVFDGTYKVIDEFPETKDATRISVRNVFRVDQETRKLLKLALPFTVSACAESLFSTLSFIIISKYATTIELTAYAIVLVLVGLSDGVLSSPFSACTTLCAHAIGAGNATLAGTYLQLAVLTYVSCSAVSFVFWWYCMYECILWLEWGENETALLGQVFIRHYMLHYILNGLTGVLWRLLEVTDNAKYVTYITCARGMTYVVVLLIAEGIMGDSFGLVAVAWVFNVVAFAYMCIAYGLAYYKGWLKPFYGGLFRTFSLENTSAMKQMLKQAGPLAIGYFFSSADWAFLTAMASHLGSAEVAAWAILGQIWDFFYYTIGGIADSGEIRVGIHLGDGRPKLAQLTAYKSLLIGMIIAVIVSIILFSLQTKLPGWFTHDETLISMLQELVPFVGVANLSMTFGMQCWSLIGAQGKYKVATWVSVISSWGVTMPLAAISVYGFRINLQGIMSATTIGYTTCGAVLSYLLLSTNWERRALKIQQRNAEIEDGTVAPTECNDSDNDSFCAFEEEMFAALPVRGAAPNTGPFRGLVILVVPAHKRCGILFGNSPSRSGPFVLEVREWSPLYGHVNPGDTLLAIGGEDAAKMDANDIASVLDLKKSCDCELVFVTQEYRHEEEEEEEEENGEEAVISEEPFGIFCVDDERGGTYLAPVD